MSNFKEPAVSEFQKMKNLKHQQQADKQRLLNEVSDEEWNKANARLRQIALGGGLPHKSYGRKSLGEFSFE